MPSSKRKPTAAPLRSTPQPAAAKPRRPAAAKPKPQPSTQPPAQPTQPAASPKATPNPPPKLQARAKSTAQPTAQPTPRLRIGVLFGGRSGEHEVSLLSAASILRALDPARYDVVPIGITKAGQWLTAEAAQHLLTGTTPTPTLPAEAAPPTNASSRPKRSAEEEPASPPATIPETTTTLPLPNTPALDLVFPVLHGTFGEDGTIQGLLELAGLPYVGSGVLGSAAGMDKVIMKQIFAAHGLPQTPFVAALRADWHADPRRLTRRIEKHLRYPVFVKPANLGSSVGISKVHDRSELAAAMDLAASFDRKLIIEEGVGGPGVKPRELEVAVLGNDTPEASVVGEIVPGAEFYDYTAKYLSNTSVPHIPADIPRAVAKKIRKMAIAAFRACDCAGLARVDFLLAPKRGKAKHKPDHASLQAPVAKPGKHNKSSNSPNRGKAKDWEIFLNEINTLPGFTSISMYPKLWEASGLPFRDLLDRLITLALARHHDRTATHFTRE